MESQQTQGYSDEIRGRHPNRSSTSASPIPLINHEITSKKNSRRNSSVLTNPLMRSNENNERIFSSAAGAIPVTKNVGVSVNFGKANARSNSSSPAGVQHIALNGHQHQQQHTPGTSVSPINFTNNHNNTNNKSKCNSAAINLGHGHIGTIAGPPCVSISSGVGSTSSSSGGGVKHISSATTSPAGSAPTTCVNKGVPSSHNHQQQHLSVLSPTTNHSRMSPHSPVVPIVNHVAPESLQLGASSTVPETSKNGNSSSSSAASSSSRNDGMCNNKNNNNTGIRTGPNSPSASSTTSSSSGGGSKGETQLNTVPNINPTSSNENDGSRSSSNTNRVVSQNLNGTLAVTGTPSNDSELQLFRVLQRANLLNYYDVMIELGGDDVQQLCDAGEEEFLEIMALIGMASKPLHVRRLQKALHEWMNQPGLFQPVGYPNGNINPQTQALSQLASTSNMAQMTVPNLMYHAIPGGTTGVPVFYPGITVPTGLPVVPDLRDGFLSNITNQSFSSGTHQIAPNNDMVNPVGNSLLNPLAAAVALQQSDVVNPQFVEMLQNLSSNQTSDQQQQSHISHSNGHLTSSKSKREQRNSGDVASIPLPISDIKIPVDQLIPSHFLETRMRTRSDLSSPASSLASSPHPEGRNSVSPVPLALQDHEIQKLADTAIHLIRSLPSSVTEPKFSSKKKTSADYELILRLSDSDLCRMEEVRRVAAVYGRADAKRKTLKPLSMHELAINESAAQLCKHVPALITKREELLSLSRQVLRESGLPYAAISSTFSISLPASSFSSNAGNSINNNDINTKSKYEESSRNHKSHCGSNGSIFNAFHSKRFRLDNSSGIEIQEYSHPHSLQGSPSSPSNSNGMQITELRCVPPRRSPSEDSIPSPLELVTVTSSDHRQNGIVTTAASKLSSVSFTDSNSPPIRRPYSLEADDLSVNPTKVGNGSHAHHGMRVPQALLHPHAASIPASGGSIYSLLNPNGASNNLSSNYFGHYLHPQQYIHGRNHSGMKFMPIKSEPEPTVN